MVLSNANALKFVQWVLFMTLSLYYKFTNIVGFKWQNLFVMLYRLMSYKVRHVCIIKISLILLIKRANWAVEHKICLKLTPEAVKHKGACAFSRGLAACEQYEPQQKKTHKHAQNRKRGGKGKYDIIVLKEREPRIISQKTLSINPRSALKIKTRN